MAWNINNLTFGIEFEVAYMSHNTAADLVDKFNHQMRRYEQISDPQYRLTQDDRQFLDEHQVSEHDLPGVWQSFAHIAASTDNGFTRANRNIRWSQARDRSVNNHNSDGFGVELVSPPLTRAWTPVVQSMTRQIRTAGGQTDISTGLHIHLGGKPFTNDTGAIRSGNDSLKRLVRNWYELQWPLQEGAKQYNEDGGQHWERLRGRTSRDKGYAKAIPESLVRNIEEAQNPVLAWYSHHRRYNIDSYDLPSIQHYHYDESRYQSINLHSLGKTKTVEFRSFKGTLHAGEVKSNIDLILHLGEFSINHPQTLNQIPNVLPQQPREAQTQPYSEKPRPQENLENYYCKLLSVGLDQADQNVIRHHLVKGMVSRFRQERQAEQLDRAYQGARRKLRLSQPDVVAPLETEPELSDQPVDESARNHPQTPVEGETPQPQEAAPQTTQHEREPGPDEDRDDEPDFYGIGNNPPAEQTLPPMVDQQTYTERVRANDARSLIRSRENLFNPPYINHAVSTPLENMPEYHDAYHDLPEGDPWRDDTAGPYDQLMRRFGVRPPSSRGAMTLPQRQEFDLINRTISNPIEARNEWHRQLLQRVEERARSLREAPPGDRLENLLEQHQQETATNQQQRTEQTHDQQLQRLSPARQMLYDRLISDGHNDREDALRSAQTRIFEDEQHGNLILDRRHNLTPSERHQWRSSEDIGPYTEQEERFYPVDHLSDEAVQPRITNLRAALDPRDLRVHDDFMSQFNLPPHGQVRDLQERYIDRQRANDYREADLTSLEPSQRTVYDQTYDGDNHLHAMRVARSSPNDEELQQIRHYTTEQRQRYDTLRQESGYGHLSARSVIDRETAHRETEQNEIDHVGHRPLTPEQARHWTDLNQGWSDVSRNGTMHRLHPGGRRDTRGGSVHYSNTEGSPEQLMSRLSQRLFLSQLTKGTLIGSSLQGRATLGRQGRTYRLLQQDNPVGPHSNHLVVQNFVNNLISTAQQMPDTYTRTPQHWGIVAEPKRNGDISYRADRINPLNNTTAHETLTYALQHHWDTIKPILENLFGYDNGGGNNNLMGLREVKQRVDRVPVISSFNKIAEIRDSRVFVHNMRQNVINAINPVTAPEHVRDFFSTPRYGVPTDFLQ